MIKHKQVLASLMELEFVGFEEISLQISVLKIKIIKDLIVGLESKSRDKAFIEIERF